MSLSVTKRDLITRALRTLQVIGQNETPSANDEAVASAQLDELVDSWAIQNLTILQTPGAIYNITVGKGAFANPYTYGPGGDWDTGTAARPPSIQDANLLLNNSTPPVEIPLAVLTVDSYNAIPLKALTNSLPVELYYIPSVPLGSVYLWPLPTDSSNQIVLYSPLVTAAWPTSFSTLYTCPPGYLKAFRLCLAQDLIPFFAVPPETAARIPLEAADALANLKESNLQMADLSVDPGFAPSSHGTYVIQTDQGA